jgi:hypothetical protein
MLKKITASLAGSLYQREASPTFVLQDGVIIPNENLVNTRHHNGKLVFDYGFSSFNNEIISQPESIEGYWEDVKTLSVVTNSSIYTFQWQSSPDNVTFTDIEGATSNTLTFDSLSPADDGYYHCVVSTLSKSVISDSAQVTCIVNPFVIAYTGSDGMGPLGRYDQRVNYEYPENSYPLFCIGIGKTASVVTDSVYAWAKDMEFLVSAGSDYGYDFNIGFGGAKDCLLILENITCTWASLFLISDAASPEGIVSTANSLVIKGGTISGEGGALIVGPFGGTAPEDSSSNSVIIRDAALLKCCSIHFNTCKDSEIIITGENTRVLLDDVNFHSSQTSRAKIALLGAPVATGNHIDLLNGALLRGGFRTVEENYSMVDNNEFSEEYNSTNLRFGGGYLAHYGDCRADGPSYWQWRFDTTISLNHTGIVTYLSCLKVRDPDGSWRQALETDFTVTYCATDAEGLAATGGLYDGLAGYTIITAGASIDE